MKEEIYILTHKEINYNLDLSQYIPIQVGAELSNKKLFNIKDNIGDNISNKNKYYSETTGIYWIWKNSNADIKGHMQFRRFLSINPLFIENVLNKYDIIFGAPITFPMSIEIQYDIFHNIDDLLNIKNIIYELYPEYIDSYNKYIKNGNILYYGNCFIANKNTYNSLCNFCFNILEKYETKFKIYDENIRLELGKKAITKYSDIKTKSYQHTDVPQEIYQSRICGFLFERLVTLYIFHNKLKVYNCGDYITMEDNMSI